LSLNSGATDVEWVTNGNGTVTSVALSVPTGLTVTGTPITTNGTFAVTFTAGYSIPTDAKQTDWDTAYGWGDHALAGYLDSSDIGVTVEAYDATILKSADIGVTVQGYDATTLKSADIGVTVQGYDATTLKSADIGVTVQGYDANTAKYDATTANFTGTLQKRWKHCINNCFNY
jgi:citrate lyase gamma subunit